MDVAQARAAMLASREAATNGARAVGCGAGAGVVGLRGRGTRSTAFRGFRYGRLCAAKLRYAWHLACRGNPPPGADLKAAANPGMAIRISTGAAIPDGVDTVVIQEDVRRDGDTVTVPSVKPEKNIRPQAGIFPPERSCWKQGRRLDGIAVSLAAATGAAELAVARAPRIAILSSGDELAAPGAVPGPYQIFDSATFGIAGLVRSWGGVAHRLAVARDDASAIARAAEQGLRDSDLLVVIGGASVGDHDHARPALVQLGLELAG